MHIRTYHCILTNFATLDQVSDSMQHPSKVTLALPALKALSQGRKVYAGSGSSGGLKEAL